jgi:hypothetical protein
MKLKDRGHYSESNCLGFVSLLILEFLSKLIIKKNDFKTINMKLEILDYLTRIRYKARGITCKQYF